MPPQPSLTSIGVSIYGQPLPWIQRCITSALTQTTENIELIVRCDGPDAISHLGRTWLRRLAREEPKMRLIEGEANLGTFGSLRKTFQDAQGGALVQLDADDILHPQAVALANSALEEDQTLSFVYTKCIEVDAKERHIREGTRQQMPYSELNMLIQFITFHMRCIRRSCYEAVGGYRPALLYSGDYDLSLRLAEVGGIRFLPLPLYYYRVHGNNTSFQRYHNTIIEAYGVARDALFRRGLADKIYLTLSSGNCVKRVDLRKWELDSESSRETESLILDKNPSSWL